MSKLADRIGRAAAFGALLAGLGFTATPAHAAKAATAGMRLEKLTKVGGPGGFKVYIRVVVPMTQAQAQAAKESGYQILTSLWGDDTFDDDLLWGPVKFPLLQATPQGLEIDSFVALKSTVLDEDPGYGGGLFDNYDELYLFAAYATPSGRVLMNGQSKTYHTLILTAH
jgi:hypothetical protein